LYTRGVAFEQLDLIDIERVRELQKQNLHDLDVEIIGRIQEAQVRAGLVLLGADRAFRKYW
jgi:hypothetical protein